MSFNLSACFFQCAERQAQHPAIIEDGGRVMSYADLQKKIVHMAEALTDAGVCSGDNIALHCPSGTDYIVVTYALWSLGASVTPIPVELNASEKQKILQSIAIDAVIGGKENLGAFEEYAETRISLDLALCLLVTRPLRQQPPQLANINPAFIRFTSGTTGDAKGVVLSHESIFERIQAANQVLSINSEDRIVWLLSMAYHFAVTIVAYLSFGASIVLPRNTFGISIVEAANRHRATMIYGAPTHYSLMAHTEETLKLPPLRMAIVTTTKLPAQLASLFLRRFGLCLNETYGIIELGLPAINFDQSGKKMGAVGQVLPAYEIKLQPHKHTSCNEILFRGPGMLDAYYQPWMTRADILQRNDGWLATGDLGEVDGDGFLSIVGRSKEMISVAGMKFFPQEVEAVLEQHHAIVEACVFAIEAPRTGQVPVAHIVLADNNLCPSEQDLTDYCAQKLTAFKVPRQFLVVPALTRTASGKIIRNAGKIPAHTISASVEAIY